MLYPREIVTVVMDKIQIFHFRNNSRINENNPPLPHPSLLRKQSTHSN